MKTTTKTITVLEKNIDITLCETGRGISVTISGGDSPHIGAVSIKSPDADMITESFPTHKDAVISEIWALKLCEAFNQSVVVSCGIHYDAITKEGISEVVHAMEAALEDIISN